MAPTNQEFNREHPLLADTDRLNEITNVMYVKIHKTLFHRNPSGRHRAEIGQSTNNYNPERILQGTAVSADDILSEAVIALLRYPPGKLKGTWEGLAVTIARNKAIDALRASRGGLRATEHRNEMRLESGDVEREGPDGEIKPSLFEMLTSNWGYPEAEFFVLQDVLIVRDLAREILDDRSQEIFFAIHFHGYTRKEIGDEHGLTSQRIGQIYNAAIHSLESHPEYPFKQSVQQGQKTIRRSL